ncbi:MAG: HNH endonuclease [Candidatus Omnitrophota bacterium]
MENIDSKLRLLAFDWLHSQRQIYGETIPYDVLKQGFMFESTRVPLVGPQGIFKPKILELPLTITTSPNSPYADKLGSEGILHYKYRGTDPQHRDNRGLRELMKRKTPLIYLLGLSVGRYTATWPVYIVGDDEKNLTFIVQADQLLPDMDKMTPSIEETRRYLTVQAQYRLHQQRFREKVIIAYRERCAICRLNHPELLDATHIIPDSEPMGDPIIKNGLALCNLHHGAFDRMIIGIRPDYIVEVRKDILEEEDGPMLEHGLQKFDRQALILPKSNRDYPDPERFEKRYSRFKEFATAC